MENENIPTEENIQPEVNEQPEQQPENVVNEQPETIPTEQPLQEPVSVEPTEQASPVDNASTEPVSQATTETTEMAPILDPGDKSKKGILFIIPIVIALVVLGALFLPKLFVSKQTVVKKEVATFFTEARKALENSEKNILEYDLEKDSLGITGKLTIDSNYNAEGIDLSKLKNYHLTYGGVIDKKQNEASGSLKLEKGTSSLLSFDAYIEGKNGIISLGDLYDKGIKTELEKEIKELDLSKNDNVKDLKLILEKTETIVKDTIKDEDITKEKVEKEFNGKKDNYTKVEYKIKEEEFIKNILEAYLKDDEIIKAISNLSSKTEKETKESLNDSIEELGKTEKQTIITLNIYLKGMNNTPKAFELIEEKETLEIVETGEKYNYRFIEDGKEQFKGEYSPKEKKLTLESEIGISLTVKTDDDTTKADFSYKEDDEEITIKATVKNTIKDSSQENDTTINFLYQMNEEKIEATITNQMTLTKNGKAEKLTMPTTIEMDAITEEEMNTITTKMYEKLESLINDIMPGMADTTNFRELM